MHGTLPPSPPVYLHGIVLRIFMCVSLEAALFFVEIHAPGY